MYQTRQRGLEAIVAYVPQYQLYQADCFGSAQQKLCRVLELFQYIKHFLSCTCISTYIPRMAHMCIWICMFTHLYTEKATLPLMLPCIKYCWIMLKGHRLKTRTIFGCVSWMSQMHISNQHYSRYKHHNNLIFCPRVVPWKHIHMLCGYISGNIFMNISKFGNKLLNTSGSNWFEYLYINNPTL